MALVTSRLALGREVVDNVEVGTRHLIRCDLVWVLLQWEVHNEAIADAERRVDVEIGISSHEQVGDKGTKCGGLDAHVDMCGTHRLAPGSGEPFATWTVDGNRVAVGLHGPKRVIAIATVGEQGAKVTLHHLGVLHVVAVRALRDFMNHSSAVCRRCRTPRPAIPRFPDDERDRDHPARDTPPARLRAVAGGPHRSSGAAIWRAGARCTERRTVSPVCPRPAQSHRVSQAKQPLTHILPGQRLFMSCAPVGIRTPNLLIRSQTIDRSDWPLSA